MSRSKTPIGIFDYAVINTLRQQAVKCRQVKCKIIDIAPTLLKPVRRGCANCTDC